DEDRPEPGPRSHEYRRDSVQDAPRLAKPDFQWIDPGAPLVRAQRGVDLAIVASQARDRASRRCRALKSPPQLRPRGGARAVSRWARHVKILPRRPQR